MRETFFQQLQTARPRLVPKARLQLDKINGKPVLLYPEGVLLLNTTGAAILRLCDGTRSVSDILALLSEEYETPAEHLAADVGQYLLQLQQQCLVELQGIHIPEPEGNRDD
jgi:pyrroloquinoline quinone biosynthesis protein D